MATERKKATPDISAKFTRAGGLADGLIEGMVLTFCDGRTLNFRAGMLSPELAQHAVYHGVKQKLVDAAAISRDPATGRAATIDTKYNAVKEIFDRITTGGTWNKGRTGDGATGIGGLLYAALVRIYDGKQSPDAIRAFLDKKSDAEQAKMRKNPKIAPVIEEIRAERLAANPDDGADDVLDDMENELGALGANTDADPEVV